MSKPCRFQPPPFKIKHPKTERPVLPTETHNEGAIGEVEVAAMDPPEDDPGRVAPSVDITPAGTPAGGVSFGCGAGALRHPQDLP